MNINKKGRVIRTLPFVLLSGPAYDPVISATIIFHNPLMAARM